MGAVKRAGLLAFLTVAMVANAVGAVHRGHCAAEDASEDAPHVHEPQEMPCHDTDDGSHSDPAHDSAQPAEEPSDGAATFADCSCNGECLPACLIACATAYPPALLPGTPVRAADCGPASPWPPSSSQVPDPGGGLYRPPRPI